MDISTFNSLDLDTKSDSLPFIPLENIENTFFSYVGWPFTICEYTIHVYVRGPRVRYHQGILLKRGVCMIQQRTTVANRIMRLKDFIPNFETVSGRRVNIRDISGKVKATTAFGTVFVRLFNYLRMFYDGRLELCLKIRTHVHIYGSI